MISLLLISNNTKTIDLYIQNICKKESIDPLDVVTVSTEGNIGIGDVREIIKKIFFKPIKSLQKMVIIKKLNTATNEAQNALLKVIEEPPANTCIMLVASTKEQILPTILSRCKIVTLNETSISPPGRWPNGLLPGGRGINEMSVAEKLKLAQDLAKNKEEATSYIIELMHRAREYMLIENRGTETVKNLLNSYKIATTTNINLRLDRKSVV